MIVELTSELETSTEPGVDADDGVTTGRSGDQNATPVGADPFQVTSKTFVEPRSKPTGLNVGATPPQMDTEGRAGAEVT